MPGLRAHSLLAFGSWLLECGLCTQQRTGDQAHPGSSAGASIWAKWFCADTWACRTFARLAEDPAFHFSEILEPGTIEVIHNATILHSRGDVEDGDVRLPPSPADVPATPRTAVPLYPPVASTYASNVQAG